MSEYLLIDKDAPQPAPSWIVPITYGDMILYRLDADNEEYAELVPDYETVYNDQGNRVLTEDAEDDELIRRSNAKSPVIKLGRASAHRFLHGARKRVFDGGTGNTEQDIADWIEIGVNVPAGANHNAKRAGAKTKLLQNLGV